MTTIEDYPYPYVIGKLCWEFPAMAPSDWEAQHIHGTNNPVTVADWKAALDVTVLSKALLLSSSTRTAGFGPARWSSSSITRCERYGPKVKFLNFREAEERLKKHLLAGQPLRAANGQDNGVRLLDLNNDGFIDVVIGNGAIRKTRIWAPDEGRWKETTFPAALVSAGPGGTMTEMRGQIWDSRGRRHEPVCL